MEEGREWRFPGLLYADDLDFGLGRFALVCRRGLKVSAGKSKVMELGGKRDLTEVCMDGMRLQHVCEFKYLRCVLDESVTDEAECGKKVTTDRRVAAAIGSG